MGAFINNSLWKWIHVQTPLLNELKNSEGEIFVADSEVSPNYLGKVVRLDAMNVNRQGVAEYMGANFEVLDHRPAYPGRNDKDLGDIRAYAEATRSPDLEPSDPVKDHYLFERYRQGQTLHRLRIGWIADINPSM